MAPIKAKGLQYCIEPHFTVPKNDSAIIWDESKTMIILTKHLVKTLRQKYAHITNPAELWTQICRQTFQPQKGNYIAHHTSRMEQPTFLWSQISLWLQYRALSNSHKIKNMQTDLSDNWMKPHWEDPIYFPPNELDTLWTVQVKQIQKLQWSTHNSTPCWKAAWDAHKQLQQMTTW
jgi:hypothetical protein